jgi:hypothetical protein
MTALVLLAWVEHCLHFCSVEWADEGLGLRWKALKDHQGGGPELLEAISALAVEACSREDGHFPPKRCCPYSIYWELDFGKPDFLQT